MLSLTSSQRYFLYGGAADMRKGIDGLSGLVRNELGKDPLGGDVFIFFNRTLNQVRLLQFDQDGFALYCKRLEKGRYELPKNYQNQLPYQTLQFILSGVELSSVKQRLRYRMAS